MLWIVTSCLPVLVRVQMDDRVRIDLDETRVGRQRRRDRQQGQVRLVLIGAQIEHAAGDPGGPGDVGRRQVRDVRPRVDARRAALQRPVGGRAVVLDSRSLARAEEAGLAAPVARAGIAPLHVAERDRRSGLVRLDLVHFVAPHDRVRDDQAVPGPGEEAAGGVVDDRAVAQLRHPGHVDAEAAAAQHAPRRGVVRDQRVADHRPTVFAVDGPAAVAQVVRQAAVLDRRVRIVAVDRTAASCPRP